MPKLGQRHSIDWLTGTRRQLTDAVRDCLDILSDVNMSQAEVARRCFRSRTTVSAIANGKRGNPDPVFVRALHKLAEDALHQLAEEHVQPGDSRRLPSIAEMDHLLKLVARRTPNCPQCGKPWDSPSLPDPLPKPAGDIAPPADPLELPVPPPHGDRQLEWEGLRSLRGLLTGNRLTDVAGILRHLGQDGDTTETAAAITACRRSGLPDMAATIALYTAQRPKGELMGIISVLLANNDIESVREIAGLAKE